MPTIGEDVPEESTMTAAVDQFRQLLSQEQDLKVRTDDNFIMRHLYAAQGDPEKAFAKVSNQQKDFISKVFRYLPTCIYPGIRRGFRQILSQEQDLKSGLTTYYFIMHHFLAVQGDPENNFARVGNMQKKLIVGDLERSNLYLLDK